MIKLLSIAIFILGLFLPNISAVSEEIQELMDSLHKTCVDETGAKDELIENARKGDFADDEPLKCYMKCLMEQMGCVDDNGIVDADAVIALMPEDLKDTNQPIIKNCGAKVGATPCESVWLTQKCYQEGSPSTYMLP